MPAGLSWTQYIMTMSCALFSMFLGSQFVHLIYRPLDVFKYISHYYLNIIYNLIKIN